MDIFWSPYWPGLRVTGMRISLTHGRQSMVMVRPKPFSAGLPVRMVAFALGGPFANLAGAALTYQVTSEPMPLLARYALFSAALPGAALGVVNLLPFRLMSGLLSDGANALRWTFGPSRARAELDTGQRAVRRVQTIRAIVGGQVDGAQLDKFVASTDDPLVLLAAIEQRWQTDINGHGDRSVADAEQLIAVEDNHPRGKA